MEEKRVVSTLKPAPETYYCFMELAIEESTGRRRLLIPHSDPQRYENPADGLFSTVKEAYDWLVEMIAAEQEDFAEARSWVLCRRELHPVVRIDPLGKVELFDESIGLLANEKSEAIAGCEAARNTLAANGQMYQFEELMLAEGGKLSQPDEHLVIRYQDAQGRETVRGPSDRGWAAWMQKFCIPLQLKVLPD